MDSALDIVVVWQRSGLRGRTNLTVQCVANPRCAADDRRWTGPDARAAAQLSVTSTALAEYDGDPAADAGSGIDLGHFQPAIITGPSSPLPLSTDHAQATALSKCVH